MTPRLTLALCALAATLAACAGMPGAPQPTASALAPFATAEAVGRSVEDVTAVNGPPTRQWDLADGRRAYQWQASSVTARVGASLKAGEIQGAASQTTCYYTLYASPAGKGWTVVGYDMPGPGCLKVAMNGAAR